MDDAGQSQSYDSKSRFNSDANGNFSHGEEFISDGVNLIGQGPDFMRSAPTDFG